MTLGRRLTAEAVGTGLLSAVVVGSGISAARLSADPGIQLAANCAATVTGLAVIILLVGPVSGAHLNPAVSLVDWFTARRGDATGLSSTEMSGYAAAQIAGGSAGTALANLMYDQPAITVATTDRTGLHQWLAEIVATAGLVAIITALIRTGRTALAPVAVAGWIGAAYWFTSSTSFANPAITLARTLSDTYTGIAPACAPAFVAAQIFGAFLGLGLAAYLYPRPEPDSRGPVDSETPSAVPAHVGHGTHD